MSDKLPLRIVVREVLAWRLAQWSLRLATPRIEGLIKFAIEEGQRDHLSEIQSVISRDE